MNPRDRGETDALVRRLRGYARVYADPPTQETSTQEVRARMGGLIREGFLELDKRLQRGEPLPEVWDSMMLHMPRVRGVPPGSTGQWTYTFPPGQPAPGRCVSAGRECDWIDGRAAESACRRCHTIRKRVATT